MRNLLLAIVALAAASTVQAQSDAAYYGLALGNFDYEENNFFLPGVVVGDKASSYRLMVGYQFMEHLSVEGGYGKTGTIRDTTTVFSPPLSVSYEFKILTVRLLGVLPFDNGVRLMGGLGYSDMKRDFVFTDGIVTIANDDTGNEPGYYLGVQYDLDRFAIRLGHEKFDFDGDVDVTETMITFFYKI
jgi:hypothetical protein